MLERRFLPQAEIRASEDGKKICGYAAVFNSESADLGGFVEVISPGAFDGVMDDDVVALVNHNPNALLGRRSAGTLRMKQDAKGLYYEVDVADTTVGRDTKISVARGDIPGSSFHFHVKEDEWSKNDSGQRMRTIKSFRALKDVGPTYNPAYGETTAGVRSIPTDDDGECRSYFKAKIEALDKGEKRDDEPAEDAVAAGIAAVTASAKAAIADIRALTDAIAASTESADDDAREDLKLARQQASLLVSEAQQLCDSLCMASYRSKACMDRLNMAEKRMKLLKLSA